MEQNENQDSIRERIRTYAFDLKLPLIRRDIDLLIQQGLDEQWNLWMFTAELLRREKENRSENQRRHRIKNAAFPQLRYLNEIDTDALPPEARKALPNLETLDFIKEGRNLILYGNPGTGKTHLATALGIAACNAGYSVLFTSVPRLLTQIRECRNAMTLRALENKFERYDMVICDEFEYIVCHFLFSHVLICCMLFYTITDFFKTGKVCFTGFFFLSVLYSFPCIYAIGFSRLFAGVRTGS